MLKINKVISILLVIILFVTSINLYGVFQVRAEEKVTIYFVDNTTEKWVSDDNSVMELVDNSSGHVSYIMDTNDNITWSVKVPVGASNLTFNRYNQEKTQLWNSWSAGGRDGKDAYYADGGEYGHWDYIEEENYFHEGDIIYIDVSEFTEWKNDGALMYVNFNKASKKDNNNQDISFNNAGMYKFNPRRVRENIKEYVYLYAVTKEDEGSKELRFWRGNSDTLWNCSAVLSYEKYSEGINCVKIVNWEESNLRKYIENVVFIDTSNFFYDTNNNFYIVNSGFDGIKGEISDIRNVKEISFQLFNNDGLLKKSCNLELKEKFSLNDFDLELGNNKIIITVTYSSGEEIIKQIYLFVDNRDDDRDGLLNCYEYIYGTDIFNEDTDGDGISDYKEINDLCTSPLIEDTDKDGVSDAQEDNDGDGICNIDEYKYSTNVNCCDTDNDGINDYDELFIYYTNPLSVDTDGDGMSDYTEILSGLNPLLQDSDNNGISDFEEIITQKICIDKISAVEKGVFPSVSITGKGDYYTKISIESIEDEEIITDIDCIIGAPYEFVHSEELKFEKCTLSFEVDNNILKDNNLKDLQIAYYDKAEDIIIPVETQYNIDASNLSANVSHFSTYLVINKTKYYNGLNTDGVSFIDDGNVYRGHTYLVLDYGVKWTDALKYCESIGGHLVTIESEEENDFLIDLVSKKNKNLYWIGLSGENNYYTWVTGNSLTYKNWARGEPNNVSETAVHMYAKAGISNSIGEWNDTFNDYYSPESFYSYSNSGFICEWDFTKEEIEGKFKVFLSNGDIIYLDKDPGMGDRSVDTDGDKVCDLDELTECVEIQIENPYKKFNTSGLENNKIKVWKFKSNPAKYDTDGDGYSDYEDPAPKKNDVKVTSLKNNNFVRVIDYGKEEDRWIDTDANLSYGGRQDWWEDTNYIISKYGCGLIAATDVMLYFNQQTRGGLSELSFLHSEVNYDNPIYDKINYSEYVKIMNSYCPCFDYIGVPAHLMACGMKNAWRNLSNQKGNLAANWGGSIVKLEDIKHMISNDIPVILSIGPNTLFFMNSEHKKGIYFYSLGLIGLVREGLMSASEDPINDHYVTVTGVIEDYISNKTYLKISSWGERYYIDYDEYMTYRIECSDNISTNIMHITF